MTTATEVSKARVRQFKMGECRASLERRDDGCLIVRNLAPLGAYGTKLTERLEHWAKIAPERVWLAGRENGAWRKITYAQALASVQAWVAERDWRRIDVVHAELGGGRHSEFLALCALAAMPHCAGLSILRCEISSGTSVSRATVNFHVGNILGKLGASTRTEAVATALRERLLPG